MSDENDPILDACLDEILGGQTPPDLAPRIMQAWSMLPPSVPVESPAAPPVQNAVKITAAKQSRAASSAASGLRRHGISIVIAASIVAVALGVGIALRSNKTPDNPNGIVENAPPTRHQPAEPRSPDVPRRNDIAERPISPPSRDESPRVITPDFSTDPPFATGSEIKPFELAVEARRVAAQDDTQVVAAIDVAIRSAWQEHDISPAPEASNEEFAARLFRQVLGRGPTADEAASFVASRSTNKRAELVENLLTSEDHERDFARHWSALWANSLIGRSGTATARQVSREGLEQYLRRAIQQSRPLDQMATELLTATGTGEIGSSQYNGATNFLLAHFDRKATQATSHVARAFLGKRVQCSQCHDHPADSTLAQSRFWEMNAFLRQLSAKQSGEGANDSRGSRLLASRDFHGDGGGDGSEAEVFFETANGEVKVAYPALPGVADVPRSGLVDQFDRRAGLARYVAGSDDFRRAVVNRVWSNIFGYGFTSPVDDMGPHNPPSHPALLSDLADQFAAHDHDLRSLIRWMVLSEPFQLGRGQGLDLADAPQLGGKRWFSRSYPPTVLKPKAQESLVVLAKAVANGELGIGTSANIKPSFPVPGRKPQGGTISPLTIASPSVVQRSKFIPVKIEQILESSMSVEQKVDHLFLVTLQRSPTKRENELVKEITRDFEKANRASLLQIWWTLDSSGE